LQPWQRLVQPLAAKTLKQPQQENRQVKIGAILPCSDIQICNEHFTLITDSQEIHATLETIGYKGEETFSGLLVKVVDADTLEVWATTFRAPWKASSLYERVA